MNLPQAEELFSNVNLVDDETLAMALTLIRRLAIITQPRTISIFPRDLNTTNYVITNTVDLITINLDQGGTTDIASVRMFIVETIIHSIVVIISFCLWNNIRHCVWDIPITGGRYILSYCSMQIGIG